MSGGRAGGAAEEVDVVFVCTGNAARSVVAGAALAARLSRARITTAGTHVVEGQPVSRRTREAMAGMGLDADGHRSHQLTDADVATADLVVGFSPEHVAYVRRRHPAAAGRTATLRRLCRDLSGGPAPLAERVRALRLDRAEPEASEDVADPAGGDARAFSECAREVVELVGQLAGRLA